jgi:hypothetical protein
LEKALKLAEVLMKEVQRLDHIVQTNKYQENPETRDSEKKHISKVKRELFSEIQNLN